MFTKQRKSQAEKWFSSLALAERELEIRFLARVLVIVFVLLLVVITPASFEKVDTTTRINIV